jgi:hypothetical protein
MKGRHRNFRRWWAKKSPSHFALNTGHIPAKHCRPSMSRNAALTSFIEYFATLAGDTFALSDCKSGPERAEQAASIKMIQRVLKFKAESEIQHLL